MPVDGTAAAPGSMKRGRYVCWYVSRPLRSTCVERRVMSKVEVGFAGRHTMTRARTIIQISMHYSLYQAAIERLTRHSNRHNPRLTSTCALALSQPTLGRKDNRSPIPHQFPSASSQESTYHPINLLRVNMAAIGIVLARVPLKSVELSFAGVW